MDDRRFTALLMAVEGQLSPAEMEKFLKTHDSPRPRFNGNWRNYQVLISAVVNLILTIILVVIGYFVAVDSRIDEIDVRLTRVETHVEHMREDISEIKDSLRDLDRKVDLVLARLDGPGGAAAD